MDKLLWLMEVVNMPALLTLPGWTWKHYVFLYPVAAAGELAAGIMTWRTHMVLPNSEVQILGTPGRVETRTDQEGLG